MKEQISDSANGNNRNIVLPLVALLALVGIGLAVRFYFYPKGKPIPPTEIANNTAPQAQPSADPLGPKVAVQSTPEIDSLIMKSLDAYNQKDYQKVVDYCETALKINSKNLIILNNLCSAYNAMGKFKDGEAACKRALEIDPEYQLAKNNLQWSLNGLAGKTN